MNTKGKSSVKIKFTLIGAFLLCVVAGYSQQLQRFQYEESKMGSPFQIILFAQDSIAAAQATGKAYLLVDSLNHILSDYEPESELNRLSRTAGKDTFVDASPLLFDLLRKSQAAWKASGGAFDITLGPLTRIWREARKTNRFPPESLVLKSRAITGMQYLLLDTVHHRVKLQLKGMSLDMGGIAKGYIAQYILDFLHSIGYAIALVNAGGDIACGAAPPGKEGWSIAVSIPLRDRVLPSNLILENKSVATSGSLYQFIEHEGKKYSHEIDPKTGYGLQKQRNVTVISPRAGLSDWLATACSILSVKRSKRLARQYGAEILILELKKGKLYQYRSKGFAYL